MHAGVHAGADRGHRLRLGEDLGVRADADLQVLAPGALLDQHLLQPHGLGRARASACSGRRRRAADDLGADGAGGSSCRRGRVPRSPAPASRSANVTPAALIACRSTGASSQGRFGSRVSGGVLASIASTGPIASPPAARSAAAGSGVSHRSRMVGKVAEISRTAPSADRDDRGPAQIRPPDPPGEAAVAASSGRAGGRGQGRNSWWTPPVG